MITSPSTRPAGVLTAVRRRPADRLTFKPMGLEDIPAIMPYLASSGVRTCDYTVGGLLMWARYFDYSYAIVDGTLFIKGVTEDDVTRPAFSLPVGRMPLSRAIGLLKEYCHAHRAMPLTFSAVPEERLEELRALGASEVSPLADWSDYLYSAEALTTLSGKKLSKKRNHVNRFMADWPDYTLDPITSENIADVKAFYEAYNLPLSKPALAEIERAHVFEVLDNLDRYPFEGAVLRVGPDRRIVAFAIGEVIGDTLYVHIEKMAHDVSGAGEAINKMFAAMMCGRHPEILYINREEDTGDPGLRYAKESYHPLRKLHKFNVEFR